MKAWKNLGSVETIYEEEYEFSSSSSSSLSPSPSSPPTPLHNRVQKWSLAEGRKTEVLIRVHGKCFHLHKDPLTSRSTYLKRELTDSVTELTLSPPLNISAETFTLVADFCYGARPVITPFNLAALRTAAELLEMTESDGSGSGSDEGNLVHVTDTYFRRVVAVNKEYASIVFRASLSLLPEAETAAFLVSSCVEALNLTDIDGISDFGLIELIEDVILTVCPEDFHIVAEAIRRCFDNHDVVYKIVDLYLRGHNGKITEEQKSVICAAVDCTKLSPKLLLEAVQNPAMPLRFVVRAMLVDQLNTRRCILSSSVPPRAPNEPARPSHEPARPTHEPGRAADTLGALLQRDAALRQASQLKASLDATTVRIKTLERELSGMRSLLAAAGRSASFHVEPSAEIAKEDRLSASSGSLGRFARARAEKPGPLSSSCRGNSGNMGPGLTKRFGQGLINGIKKAFGVRTHHGQRDDHGWELS